MTNTRITDVEILERRYPVHVRKFMLRPDTGGTGRFKGGDGVLREILFRAPLTLSVLTERRVLQPYGLKGEGQVYDRHGELSLSMQSPDRSRLCGIEDF